MNHWHDKRGWRSRHYAVVQVGMRFLVVFLACMITHCSSSSRYLRKIYSNDGTLISTVIEDYDSPWRMRVTGTWRFREMRADAGSRVFVFVRTSEGMALQEPAPRCVIQFSRGDRKRIKRVLESRHYRIVADYQASGWSCGIIRRDILHEIQRRAQLKHAIGLSYECRNVQTGHQAILLAFAGEFRQSIAEVTFLLNPRDIGLLRQELASIVGSMSHD